MRILLIEDDRDIGDAVGSHMRSEGHAVDWAGGIKEGRGFVDVVSYNLILLDLTLPDGSGLDFLRDLRKRGDGTAVIILTSRDQFTDRIQGLNTGADDYLVKPFDLGELSARIHAVARRYRSAGLPVITLGSLAITSAERRVENAGVPVTLTAREWAVLDSLLDRPGATVSKSRIEDALYAFGAEVESNTVEVYVSRLRKKLGGEHISTVRGVGYRLFTDNAKAVP